VGKQKQTKKQRLYQTLAVLHKQTYLLLDLLRKREAAFSSNVRRVGSMAELVQILNHCPGPQRNNKNHFFHRFLFAN
jgi:hypothetical protein